MFNTFKKNIFKFLKRDKKQNYIASKLDPVKLEKNKILDRLEIKQVDRNERLKKKLQLIARRTKSARIRKKNIKRLVSIM